jgi:hypothetical protein
MRVAALFAILPAALASIVACDATDSTTGPSPLPRDGLVTVTSVEFILATSFPAQVSARIQGTVPDGCTQVGAIAQQRDGNVITVTIRSHRPTDGPCTTALKDVVVDLRLEGAFGPGTYTVRINGTDWTFRT